jgi:stress-induced morphogen
MKKILLAITSLLFLMIQTDIASGQIPVQIESGLKNGNARMVAGYFNNNVELVILDKENICSKEQGEMILSDFFSKNKPTDFRITHQSGTDSVYGIGKMQTSGANYRIIMMMKTFSGKSLIVQLRIEKD